MGAPLLFGILVGLLVLIGFLAVWRTLRARDPIEARLKEFALEEALAADTIRPAQRGERRSWPLFSRLLSGFGLGQKLATGLARADLPMTAAEFALIMITLALLGFFVGNLRAGPVLGLMAGVCLAYLPILYMKRKQGSRLKAITAQLSDALTMLTGALRAGYGLTQALSMLSQQLPLPASKEFGRVVRSVSLGLPVQQAMRDMAMRIDSDDLDLIVTAINVQYEMGGNLAQTLETIGETVRDRLRMLQEIRVMTAQQRFTGYFLAVWPALMAVALYFINPKYIMQLAQPGWPRLLPIGAVVLEVLGFLVIRKIVDIEV